jgi:hypothetical protein
MALLRRVKRVPLTLPRFPHEFRLPDGKVSRKNSGEVRRITDAALAAALTVELPPQVARFVEIFSIVLAPVVATDEAADLSAATQADMERWAGEIRAPLSQSARVGVAFAQVEIEEDRAAPGLSDSIVNTALGYASCLHTRVGPDDFRMFMWYAARTGYFLTRAPLAATPESAVPPLQDIVEGGPRQTPRTAPSPR